MSRFVMITHRITEDCHRENENLKTTLSHFCFGNYTVERSALKCSNDNCNKSFCLVLQDNEYQRFLETVYQQVQPKVMSHSSISELTNIHFKAVDRKNNNTQTTSSQTEIVDLAEKYVETENVILNDTECQTEVETSEKATNTIENETVEIENPNNVYQNTNIILKTEEIQEDVSVDNISGDFADKINNNNTEVTLSSSTSSVQLIPSDCPIPVKRYRSVGYSSLLYNSVECEKCMIQLDPENVEEIGRHITEEHCKYKRYECRLCRIKYSLLRECHEHLRMEHPNMLDIEKIFVDNVNAKYVEEVSRISKCTFPELFKGSKSVEMSKVIVGMNKEAELSVFPKI